MKRLPLLLAAFLLSIAGCSTVLIDPSIQAVDAGDYTLAVSACEAAPGQGMDICRVREKAAIESSWRLFIPAGKAVLGGEVDVYYRDLHRSYAVAKGDGIIEIPWKDFFGQTTWDRSMDGEALALVALRFATPNGVEEVVKFRGIAKIVVTKEGYDRLPIDSSYGAFKTTCKIQYSTAGRSAVECK